jgi:NAD(P)-dependent dehydrogenase (short-subunit alcohol dehydrogenase family)
MMTDSEAEMKGVVIVTGGASGIGEAVALRLLADGFLVAVLDIRPGRLPSEVAFVQGDQRDERAWREVLTALKLRFGLDGPSAVVLNAALGGGDAAGDVETVALDRWREVFEVNVIGSVLGLRACLPHMVERGEGAIVIMGSVDSLFAEQDTVAYACSKATLLQLGRCVAVDYARRGIRVNVVCPGIVDTPALRAHLSTATAPDTLEVFRRERTPLGRFLAPSEVAGVVSFLVGPDSGGMTGGAVMVDGGLTASYDFRTASQGL